MGHSYKGGSVPPGNHNPAPPLSPILISLGSGNFQLNGVTDDFLWFLYRSTDGGATYEIIDAYVGPSPIIYNEADVAGEYFADQDNTLSGPGPNSSNVLTYV